MDLRFSESSYKQINARGICKEIIFACFQFVFLATIVIFKGFKMGINSIKLMPTLKPFWCIIWGGTQVGEEGGLLNR